jgi:hypothetical protein
MTISYRSTVLLILFATAAILLLTACSTGTVASHTESFEPKISTRDQNTNSDHTGSKSQKYVDSIAVLKGYDVFIDGKKASVDSTRVAEVRDAVSWFMAQLRDNGIFMDVNPENSMPNGITTKTLYLKFDDKEDLNRGSAAAQAFFVGFFTLGMGNGATTATYGYETHVTLRINREGGIADTYEALAQASESYHTHSSQERITGIKKARTSVTENALKAILSQLKDE